MYEILVNPKCTGYQVFYKRASRSRRGKVNHPRFWVWSPEPVHEPLIPKWMYDELTARRKAKRGSRHNSGYYRCHPMSNNRGRLDKYTGHEKAAYIREDSLLDAVSAFFADRVFGPHRRELLAADLATVDDRETRQREAERERLQRALADLARPEQRRAPSPKLRTRRPVRSRSPTR